MDASFRITLEVVNADPSAIHFRVAFDSSIARWLLPYPEVTGLRFTSKRGGTLEWSTRYLVTEPRDEFVLNPDDRIAFDLKVHTGVEPNQVQRWAIRLSPDEYDVSHVYSVEPNDQRSDYLGKGSRFADITPPWIGAVSSSVLHMVVPIGEP